LVENTLKERTNIRAGKTLTGDYIVLYIPDEDVQAAIFALNNTKLDAYSLVVGLMGKEALDASGITPIQQQPFLDLKGSGVLLGFIDSGIDYTNAAFKYENNTTKIQYIWDQTINSGGESLSGTNSDTASSSGTSPTGANSGTESSSGTSPTGTNFDTASSSAADSNAASSGTPSAPSGYGFGTEFSAARINEALSSPNPYNIVPHRDTVGHGTFLASVAAGREGGEYLSAAPDAELIVVKLRKAGKFYLDTYSIPKEEENAFESIDVMLGIEYIMEKAAQLKRPVSICISVGTNLGGHDGFNIFEEYLARVSHNAGVTVCCAAGNESNTAHHASGKIAKAGDDVKIEITAGSTSSDIYITIWNYAADRISVSVTSPTGEMIGRVPAKNGTVVTENLIFEKSTVIIYYFFPVEGSGNQLTVIRILAATPGIWAVTAHGDIIVDGRYHTWLPITGFVNSGVEFLSPDPNCTLVVPASAIGVIACAGFNSLDKSLYAASSWGPTRLPLLVPDFAAPAVNVKGAFPANHGEMAGTSVAAAISAGACALLLQWGVVNKNEPFIDTYLARAYLIRGCERDSGTAYPNTQWGYGRLNLLSTFNQLRRV
jgi:hypothetical protein